MKSPSSPSWGFSIYGSTSSGAGGLHLRGAGVYKNRSISFEIYLIFQFSR